MLFAVGLFATLIFTPGNCQDVESCTNLTIGHSNISDSVGVVGELVSGECISGYITPESLLSNSYQYKITSKCLQNGTWSYTSDCVRAPCPTISLESANPSTLSGIYGDVVNITCNEGWFLGPSMTSYMTQCSENGTWEPFKECLKNCPVLSPPANGSLSTSNITYGTVVKVTCDPGFALTENDTLACIGEGWNKTWWNASVPNCQVNCPMLVAPKNGSLSTDTVFYGTVVTVTCEIGFYVQNDSPVSCGKNGTWNATVPTCKMFSCGAPPSKTGLVIDAAKSHTTQTFGSNVIYECATGYDVMQGSTLVTCQSNTTWSPLPFCYKNCPTLPIPQNGSLSTTNVSFNTMVEIFCSPGFKHTDHQVISCGENGTWNGTLQHCAAVPSAQRKCPELPNIKNGKARHYGDSLVKYICDDGFELDGEAMKECRDGSWIPKAFPKCQSTEDNSKKFTPQVFVASKLWKGHYVYRGASFDFTFTVRSVDDTFFGNITGEFADKISIIRLIGLLRPPNSIKLKLLQKSGEPRFDQDNLVFEGSLNFVDNEWQCIGKIISPGFGQFYMVPAHSDTTIQLPEHKFHPPKDSSPKLAKGKSSKKAIAIVLPIIFLLLAVAVCAILFVMYRHGWFGKQQIGMTRFSNPMYDPQSSSST